MIERKQVVKESNAGADGVRVTITIQVKEVDMKKFLAITPYFGGVSSAPRQTELE